MARGVTSSSLITRDGSNNKEARVLVTQAPNPLLVHQGNLRILVKESEAAKSRVGFPDKIVPIPS